MVERRLGFVAESLCRDLGSFVRLELSLEEARDETAGEEGATGRYWDERCLRECKHNVAMMQQQRKEFIRNSNCAGSYEVVKLIVEGSNGEGGQRRPAWDSK